MAEENQVQQVTKEPQQVKQVTKEAAQPPSRVQPAQRVTTKNPKKLEVCKRLAAHNHNKREEQRKEQAQLEKRGVNQYYGIGAVLALGVIGGLGYYIYQSKKGQVSREVKDVLMPYNPPQQPRSQVQAQTNKFEMD